MSDGCQPQWSSYSTWTALVTSAMVSAEWSIYHKRLVYSGAVSGFTTGDFCGCSSGFFFFLFLIFFLQHGGFRNNSTLYILKKTKYSFSSTGRHITPESYRVCLCRIMHCDSLLTESITAHQYAGARADTHVLPLRIISSALSNS